MPVSTKLTAQKTWTRVCSDPLPSLASSNNPADFKVAFYISAYILYASSLALVSFTNSQSTCIHKMGGSYDQLIWRFCHTLSKTNM